MFSRSALEEAIPAELCRQLVEVALKTADKRLLTRRCVLNGDLGRLERQLAQHQLVLNILGLRVIKITELQQLLNQRGRHLLDLPEGSEEERLLLRRVRPVHGEQHSDQRSLERDVVELTDIVQVSQRGDRFLEHHRVERVQTRGELVEECLVARRIQIEPGLGEEALDHCVDGGRRDFLNVRRVKIVHFEIRWFERR